MAVIQQKKFLVTVNSFKQQIMFCQRFENVTIPTYPSLPLDGQSNNQSDSQFSLTLQPISSQYSIYVETKWVVCTLNNLPNVSSLPTLLAIKPVKMGNIDFANMPHFGHLSKGSCLGASYIQSTPCIVWCRYIFCRLRYVFDLSRDPTKPLH